MPSKACMPYFGSIINRNIVETSSATLLYYMAFPKSLFSLNGAVKVFFPAIHLSQGKNL
jgi:hypothetical protein